MRRMLTTLMGGVVLLIPLGVGCNKAKKGESFNVTKPGDVTVQAEGEQQVVEIAIERKEGFEGELTAEISDLPEGVEVTEDSVTIAKNATKAKFMLKAVKDAKVTNKHKAKITVSAKDESIPVALHVTVASAKDAVGWSQKAAKLRERVKKGIKTVDEKISTVKGKLADATKEERATLSKTMENLNEKRKELQKDLARVGENAGKWTKETYHKVASNIEDGLNRLNAWLEKQFKDNDS